MTSKLDIAIARLKALPEDRREALLDAIIDLAGEPRYVLDDEQLAELDLSIEEAEQGKTVSQTQMAALWKKYGL